MSESNELIRIEHQRKVNTEILTDFVNALLLSDEVSREIIKAIHLGKIRHVKIQY